MKAVCIQSANIALTPGLASAHTELCKPLNPHPPFRIPDSAFAIPSSLVTSGLLSYNRPQKNTCVVARCTGMGPEGTAGNQETMNRQLAGDFSCEDPTLLCFVQKGHRPRI